MSDYPNVNQSRESKLSPFSDASTTIIETAGGTPIFIFKKTPSEIANSRYMTLAIVHRYVSDADKQLLVNHYLANFNLQFSFTYQADNSIYTCGYAKLVDSENWEDNNTWRVANELVGIKV